MSANKEALIFNGKPGAGKTTVGRAVASHLGDVASHVSLGDVIRGHNAAAVPNKKGRKPRIDPIRFMKELLSADESKLLIIDGFPRTKEQLAFY